MLFRLCWLFVEAGAGGTIVHVLEALEKCLVLLVLFFGDCFFCAMVLTAEPPYCSADVASYRPL